MALALVHRTRAEEKEKVVGNLTYLDPTEAQRALELWVKYIMNGEPLFDLPSAISMRHRVSLEVNNRYCALLRLLITGFDGPDDNNFAVAIWRALIMQTRIGGVSLAGKPVCLHVGFRLITLNKAMDSMIASAKKSEEEYDRFYGPSGNSIRDG